MITVDVREDFATGDKLLFVRVPRLDLQNIKLDSFDRAVINTPIQSAADVFQDLEILARRQAEQDGDA
jgi:hypothetical protein